jgi:hypothetical protein
MGREYYARDIFCINPQFRVLICQKCECAVRPAQVQTHLSSTAHRIPSMWVQHIHSAIQQWDDIDKEAQVDNWPRQIDEPIHELPIYKDGITCRLCEGYTCRQIRTMKIHWLKVHSYRVYNGSGRPPPTQIQAIQGRIEANSRPVPCQRLFTQGPGSHYIRVVQPDPQVVPPDPIPDTDAIRQLLQTVSAYQEEDQKAQDTIIQAGDLDEATPWLNRTGWVQYLQGTPRQPLIESTRCPKENVEGPERAILVIWQAIERLAYVSQEIAKVCGHLLRIEVVRTTKDESPHKPLLAYLDATAIKKHVAPWQHILMFFARTQVRTFCSVMVSAGYGPGPADR